MPKGRPKKIKEAVKVVEQPAPKLDGKIEGMYSTSLWNNGELISFDIDWELLKKHVGDATSDYK